MRIQVKPDTGGGNQGPGVGLGELACYLAVNAAVTPQAAGQTGVDPGVPGKAGELVQTAGLEGKRRLHTQILIRIVSTLVHGVTAPPVWDTLPI